MARIDDKNDEVHHRSESAAIRITHPDIFGLIINFCDKPTLAKLSLVNHSFDDLVTPKLFEYIAIDYKNGRHTFDLPASPALGEEPADRTRNDTLTITARFRRALSFARVFTHGLPKAVLEALSGVHTVRLIPIIVASENSYPDLPHVRVARLCGETTSGSKSCNLQHIYLKRCVIISNPPTKAGLDFELYESMGCSVTEAPGTPFRPTTFGKTEVVVVNTANLTRSPRRSWLSIPFANVPLTVMIKGGWGDIPAIQSRRTEILLRDLFSMICRVAGCDIRLACDREDVERLRHAHTMHGFRREFSDIWRRGEIKRYKEKVTFVDREEVMKEKWVEAFKGADLAGWY